MKTKHPVVPALSMLFMSEPPTFKSCHFTPLNLPGGLSSHQAIVKI